LQPEDLCDPVHGCHKPRHIAGVGCIGHQRTGRSVAGFHLSAEFGRGELQHLRCSVPAQLPALLSARQCLLSRSLAVRVIQVRPMRRQFNELAFLVADQTVRSRD